MADCVCAVALATEITFDGFLMDNNRGIQLWQNSTWCTLGRSKAKTGAKDRNLLNIYYSYMRHREMGKLAEKWPASVPNSDLEKNGFIMLHDMRLGSLSRYPEDMWCVYLWCVGLCLWKGLHGGTHFIEQFVNYLVNLDVPIPCVSGYAKELIPFLCEVWE